MKYSLILCLLSLGGCTVADLNEVRGITADAFIMRANQQQEIRYKLREAKFDLIEQVARECANNALDQVRDTSDLTKTNECIEFIDAHMPSLATPEVIQELKP